MKLLANIVVAIHWVWVLLMFLCLPAVLLFPQISMLVLVFASLTVTSWIITRGCPLRFWELSLRRKFDPHGIYSGMFITHYINKYLGTRLSDFQVRVIIYPWMIMAIVISVIRILHF